MQKKKSDGFFNHWPRHNTVFAIYSMQMSNPEPFSLVYSHFTPNLSIPSYVSEVRRILFLHTEICPKFEFRRIGTNRADPPMIDAGGKPWKFKSDGDLRLLLHIEHKERSLSSSSDGWRTFHL